MYREFLTEAGLVKADDEEVGDVFNLLIFQLLFGSEGDERNSKLRNFPTNRSMYFDTNSSLNVNFSRVTFRLKQS